MTVLAVDQLSKRYRNGTLANDGLSFRVDAGEVYGLLGPNGAGKTTLVGQVLGLLRPSSGSIHLDGRDVVADPAYARRTIGFLPQGQFNMESIKVEELIGLIGQLRGLPAGAARTRAAQLVEQLDLAPFRNTAMSAASGGVRRLTGFATAIAASQRMLVLDEPTNDVDPARRQLLWSAISGLRNAGTAVLLVTHNLAEAERVIDRFAIIDHGRILREGTPAALRSLVTDQVRLELTVVGSFEPHPALLADPAAANAFLFAPGDLAVVSSWLQELRERDVVLDYRIGPPTLDDIYLAALGRGAAAQPQEVA